MDANEIKRLIEAGMPGAEAIVRGDDGVHFEAVVISASFTGKPMIQQHRMVYRSLGGRMENEEIHALALKTYTPESWQASGD